MLLMNYPYIGGEQLFYHSKKATWNLFYAYIDAHSQRSIDEFPGDGVQAISIFQYQCENMTFSEQIVCNRIFSKWCTKEGGQQ